MYFAERFFSNQSTYLSNPVSVALTLYYWCVFTFLSLIYYLDRSHFYRYGFFIFNLLADHFDCYYSFLHKMTCSFYRFCRYFFSIEITDNMADRNLSLMAYHNKKNLLTCHQHMSRLYALWGCSY